MSDPGVWVQQVRYGLLDVETRGHIHDVFHGSLFPMGSAEFRHIGRHWLIQINFAFIGQHGYQQANCCFGGRHPHMDTIRLHPRIGFENHLSFMSHHHRLNLPFADQVFLERRRGRSIMSRKGQIHQ